MLGLFSSPRRRPGAAEPWRARLRLESLEIRDCPSAGQALAPLALAPSGQTASALTQPTAHSAPVISNFTATQGSNNVWTFTGLVTDDSPAGLTVNFGGLPSLQDKTATVGADGRFSLTVALAQGESGEATAQVTDWWGLTSNLAWVMVNPIIPPAPGQKGPPPGM
jgi:hypothetical protein